MSSATPAVAVAAMESAGAALAAACGGGGVAPQALSSLGAALASRAALDAATTNLIISPLSIYLALILALNAAGMGSQTQAELLRALCAASQVGKSGYPSLAPGGGLPSADAAKAEAALNADVAQLARALMASSSSGSPSSPGGGGGAAAAAKNSSSPTKNATATATATTPTTVGAELLLANSLWTQAGPNGANVSADYASRMASLLGAVARKGDADAVNAWAKEATKGLIPQAVAPGTRFDLLLANAVYFKGQWERAFSKDDTLKDAEFRALMQAMTAPAAGAKPTSASASAPGAPAVSALAFAPKKVQMMQLRVKGPDDRSTLRAGKRGPLIMLTTQFIAVRLPYKGDRQSAVLVLPRDEAPGALQQLLTTGGSMGRGGVPFDWRRDLSLAPVPQPWVAAVGNATGKTPEELRRLGGPAPFVPSPPTLRRPPAGGAADPADRLVPMPRTVDLPVPQPTLPMGEQWLPPSTRSSGGLELKVPKFRAETKQLRLKKALSDASGLAISAAFDSSTADFSRATEQKERLAVDDVIHSAVVVVDEEGTEAAAVTAVVMMRTAMPMVEEDPPVRVVLDRPFLFGVVDDATGTPMFTGSVVDPEWREA
jgi:serine protease inhibitor